MAKVRALITLVVGKNKQIAPNGVCDVGENEAKRLISLGYAESLKKNTPPTNTEIRAFTAIKRKNYIIEIILQANDML